MDGFTHEFSRFTRELGGFTREFSRFTRKLGGFTREFSRFTRELGGFTREFNRFTREFFYFLKNDLNVREQLHDCPLTFRSSTKKQYYTFDVAFSFIFPSICGLS
ncbi:hypothetical protein ABG775_12090 [Peribacillus simplex]|uniref:hypothetical protein n=1 Tax=Peribacillus TaxID=2675229 RepID=UPI00177B9123|nr:hypothetical protein [Brevibacillus sp. JNUCC-41]QOS89098.1 hypothetical protein JNUCC41_20340 [Brevibacillus sp. JNUCC-41]